MFIAALRGTSRRMAPRQMTHLTGPAVRAAVLTAQAGVRRPASTESTGPGDAMNTSQRPAASVPPARRTPLALPTVPRDTTGGVMSGTPPGYALTAGLCHRAANGVISATGAAWRCMSTQGRWVSPRPPCVFDTHPLIGRDVSDGRPIAEVARALVAHIPSLRDENTIGGPGYVPVRPEHVEIVAGDPVQVRILPAQQRLRTHVDPRSPAPGRVRCVGRMSRHLMDALEAHIEANALPCPESLRCAMGRFATTGDEEVFRQVLRTFTW